MPRAPKPFEGLDSAIVDILTELVEKSASSRRQIILDANVGINRGGMIFRKEGPGATVGELSRLAEALGTTASRVVREAESRLESEEPTSAPDGAEGSFPSLSVVEGGGDAALEPPMPDFSQLAARKVTSRPEWDAAQQDGHAD